MRKTLYIAAALLMVLPACKKSVPAPSVEKGMTFEASTAPTKSHFGETGLALYWDEYDDMAVYSITATSSDPVAGATSGLAYIRDGFDTQTAHFQSARTESEWFNGAADGESRRFVAYYPAYGQPMEFDEVTVDDNTVDVLPVYVNDSQNGLADFGRYHFMLSRANNYTKGQSVILRDFEPLTSLLKFKLMPDSAMQNAGVDYKIERISIQAYFYGKVHVNSPEEEDTYWWEYEYAPDSWRQVDNIVGFRYITVDNLLDTASPVKLQKFLSNEVTYSSNGRYLSLLRDLTLDLKHDQPTQDLYAVVFPTEEYPFRGNIALWISARYDAYNGNEYLHGISHEGYVTIPSPGFEAGKRYDFIVTLSPDEMYLQNDPNAPDWGYEVINW